MRPCSSWRPNTSRFRPPVPRRSPRSTAVSSPTWACCPQTILALAFIAQVTRLESPFFAFALVLLPLVYYIGYATIERVHQIWGEWLLYQIGINRIRHFYLEVHPDLSRYLALPVTDDIATSLESIGIPRSRWRWTTGVSGMIGVVNSLVAGVLAGLTARQAGLSHSSIPWLAGAVGFAISLVLLRAQLLRSERRHTARITSEFPADQPADAPTR
jgi:hypothetical protein